MPVMTTRLRKLEDGAVPENLLSLINRWHNRVCIRGEFVIFRKFCKQFDSMVEIQMIRNIPVTDHSTPSRYPLSRKQLKGLRNDSQDVLSGAWCELLMSRGKIMLRHFNSYLSSNYLFGLNPF